MAYPPKILPAGAVNVRPYEYVLSPSRETAATPAPSMPDAPHSGGFQYLLSRNTLIIAGLSLIGVLLSSSIAPQAARIAFPGQSDVRSASRR